MNGKLEPRKLSLYQAYKVREFYERGANQRWLADRFGVSKGTIKDIVQYKSYKEAL